MRVGIVGGGVSGMASAWFLQGDHEVTLLEKAEKLGGHVETIPVVVEGKTVFTELGPRFFFESAYPYFLGLLRLLGVPTRWNEGRASFTNLRLGQTTVLPPCSVRQVAGLLRSPRHFRNVLAMRRIVGEQRAVWAGRDFSVSLRQYLEAGKYPASFGPELIYPFLSACWGAPLEILPEFPVYSLLKGMPPGDKAGFHEIDGGVARYVRAFAETLARVDVRLGAGARRIGRGAEGRGFVVEDERGETHRFDQLIVATSSRDAAALLREVPGAEEMQAAVGSFRHFETEIVVHGDPALMPPDPRDWTHNNLFVDGDHAWMSDWQGLRDGVPVFRTWLPKGRPEPRPFYGRRHYHHLIMTPENGILQRRIAALQGASGLWVTGMYAADVDNHESALLSAVPPARALAPKSETLAKLLAAVAPNAAHGLEVLPTPFTNAAAGRGADGAAYLSVAGADESVA